MDGTAAPIVDSPEPPADAPHRNRGGRPKGSRNKINADLQQFIRDKAKPIEFLAQVVRGYRMRVSDPDHLGRAVYQYPTMEARFKAATILADKILPSLKAQEVTGADGQALFPPGQYGGGLMMRALLLATRSATDEDSHELDEALSESARQFPGGSAGDLAAMLDPTQARERVTAMLGELGLERKEVVAPAEAVSNSVKPARKGGGQADLRSRFVNSVAAETLGAISDRPDADDPVYRRHRHDALEGDDRLHSFDAATGMDHSFSLRGPIDPPPLPGAKPKSNGELKIGSIVAVDGIPCLTLLDRDPIGVETWGIIRSDGVLLERHHRSRQAAEEKARRLIADRRL
jgi:hypothetical protein